MNDIRERLQRRVAMLERLERRREETKNPTAGFNAERMIIDFELNELELDIIADPGALESQLIKVRRREDAQ
jgi:hypothetical protein